MRLLQNGSSLLFFLLLCIGCGGGTQVATFNAAEGRMEYETDEITVIRQVYSKGLGSGSSITLQGRARCQGRNCTPDVATLMFSVSGNADVSFQDRTVQITADGERYEWKDHMKLRQEEALEQSVVAGRIAGVRVRLSQLEQIVNASSVTGSIGNRSFELDEDDRAELRTFLSAMRDPAAGQEGDAS